MTPPDHSANTLMQECLRMKLEQLRLAKNQSNMLSTSPSPFNLSSSINRLSSSASSVAFKKQTNPYFLVSKCFTSPTDIIPLIFTRKVMLECLYTRDATAYGTVRVHNIAFEKRVFARITENDWKSFHDMTCSYSMSYPNNNTDTFMFEIRLPKCDDPTKFPRRIYFAICFQSMNQEFWDNNDGLNYVLDVIER